MGWVCPVCGKVRPPQIDFCCTVAVAQPPDADGAGGASQMAQVAQIEAQSSDAAVVAFRAVKPKHRKARTYDLPGWLEFWKVYPQKLDKAKAYDAFVDAVGAGAEPVRLIAAAQKYATYCRINRIEAQHVKYAQGWLNGERWNDELDLPAAVGELDPATIVGTPEYQARQIADGVW